MTKVELAKLRTVIPEMRRVRRIHFIGIGGAAKAAIYALKKSGYQKIFVTNRTVETGKLFAERYGLTFVTDTELATHEFDLVFNATPIGMGVYAGRSPISAALLRTHQIVFDSIYHPRDTQLLIDAKNANAYCLYGWQMLLYQGVRQFELYTNRAVPIQALQKMIQK
jgi:shikimate 5-dehydrogenase